MIQRIFVFTILFITLIANAQTNTETDIEKLTSDFIKDLQSKKIDTICVYKEYCVTGFNLYDNKSLENNNFCEEGYPNSPVYIFWKERGKTYATKVSICFEYSEVINLKNDFWIIYFSNQDVIKKEKIKPFENEPPRNNGRIRSRITVDHSCYKNFKILINDTIIEKGFDNFDLQKTYKSNSNNQSYNINYKHNINLKSKQLIDILEKLTSKAEKNNTFKKIKSR